MEHRGVEYRIIQGIQRGIWKWSVETEPGTKSGISDSKDAAMAAAKRAICRRPLMNDELKHLSPTQNAGGIVFAFGITGARPNLGLLRNISVYFGILCLAGEPPVALRTTVSGFAL